MDSPDGRSTMTMPTIWRSLSGPGLAAALFLLPAAGSAQDAGPTGEEVLAWTAGMLEDEARSRAGSSKSYHEASELYRRAASVRGEDDPKAIENLRAAGTLAYYAGRAEEAVKDFRRAGDIASEQGLPNETLEAYYDAAWVAHRARRHETAHRIARRITILTMDPHFLVGVEPDVLARVMKLRAGTG